MPIFFKHRLSLSSFSLILKTCGELELALETPKIHNCAVKVGFVCDVYVGTSIIDAYMKIHRSESALRLFDEIPHRNLATYNAVICGFRRSGNINESVSFLRRLQREGFLPTSAIIAGLLPGSGSLEFVCQLHGISVKLGFDLDDYVSTSLVSTYLQFEEVCAARRVFDLLPAKKVVVYNSMISGLSRNGLLYVSVRLFIELMGLSREKPNASTLVSTLSACSDLLDLKLGRQIHGYVMKRRELEKERDGLVGSALLNMYFKCGSLVCALQLFDRLPHRGLPAWNSAISGLLHHELFDGAFKLFQRLVREGEEPDSTTWNLMISGFSQEADATRAFGFSRMMVMASSGLVPRYGCKVMTSLLQLCSTSQNLRIGKEIHSYALRSSYLYDDLVLTALLTMYMRCGDSLHASKVFEKNKSKKDVTLCNAMISGYGWNGESEKAMEIVTWMERESVKPNASTFLSAISLCSHVGDVERGCKLLRKMEEIGTCPTEKHFSCVVDLLGRLGRLEEAWSLVKEMAEPATSAHYSLLSAAASHGDAEVGEMVAGKLLVLDPGNPSPLVLLSKIFAERGRWEDVERMRERVGQMVMKRSSGLSRIQAEKSPCSLNG